MMVKQARIAGIGLAVAVLFMLTIVPANADPVVIDMGELTSGNYDPVGSPHTIDGWDMTPLVNGFGHNAPDPVYYANIGADANLDGRIDGWDMTPLVNNWGKSSPIEIP